VITLDLRGLEDLGGLAAPDNQPVPMLSPTLHHYQV